MTENVCFVRLGQDWPGLGSPCRPRRLPPDAAPAAAAPAAPALGVLGLVAQHSGQSCHRVSPGRTAMKLADTGMVDVGLTGEAVGMAGRDMVAW